MLYEEGAPITLNFIKLTTTGFYDGCKFHRCIDDFVAQTGDPNSKNDNPYDDGYGGSDQTIPLEINDTLTHIDGRWAWPAARTQLRLVPVLHLRRAPALAGRKLRRIRPGRGGTGHRKADSRLPDLRQQRPVLKDHPVDDITMTALTYTPGRWDNSTNAAPGRRPPDPAFREHRLGPGRRRGGCGRRDRCRGARAHPPPEAGGGDAAGKLRPGIGGRPGTGGRGPGPGNDAFVPPPAPGTRSCVCRPPQR